MTLSVIADLFSYLSNSDSLRAVGWLALVGAAIGAAFAVIAGLFDMNRQKIEHEAHEGVHTHMKVGLTLFAIVAGLTIWRWLIYINSHNSVGWGYLAAAFIALALTFFQGWLGGELVFSDGIGVAPTGQGSRRSREKYPLKHFQSNTINGWNFHPRLEGRKVE